MATTPFQQISGIIQVAGVLDQREADMLLEAGVDWLGFPKRLTHHPEDLSDEAAAAIIKSIPPPLFGVLITYLDKATEIQLLCHFLGAKAVQLHGDVSVAEVKALKQRMPDLFIIKSLIVRGDNQSELEAGISMWSSYVDAFITDTFDASTGASGATGKTHDWQISKRLVELSPKPIILAGGLNPTNVGQAIETVRPWGVDAHTGLEDEAGRKDASLVREFVKHARRAFQRS